MKTIRNILSFAVIAVSLAAVSAAQQPTSNNSKLDEKPVAAEGKSAACQHGDGKDGQSCCAKMSAEGKGGMSCCAHHAAATGDHGAMSCGKHDHDMSSTDGKEMSCCQHSAAKSETVGSCCGEKDMNAGCCSGKDGKSCCGSATEEKTTEMACCSGGHCGMKGHTEVMK